jgi:hypothetical protein
MSVKSVNFGGYATPLSRAKRAKRAWSTQNMLACLRALGMSDAKIKAVFLEMKAAQKCAQLADSPARAAASDTDMTPARG